MDPIMEPTTETQKALFERFCARGPLVTMKGEMEKLFNAGFNVVRSGPEVVDGRATDKFLIIAERMVESNDQANQR